VSTFSSPQAILGIMPAGGNETKQIDRVFMSSRKYSQVASSVADFQEAGKGMLMCNINHLSQKLTFYGNLPMNLNIIFFFVYLTFGMSEYLLKVGIIKGICQLPHSEELSLLAAPSSLP
jgi:hypothetical protein